MNLKNIFPFLFLFIACSSTSYIRDVNDFKDADKTKPFVYTKIKLEALSNRYEGYALRIENLLQTTIDKDLNKCVLFQMKDPGKLITGRFEMQAGNRMAKPRSIKRWEFNDIKQGFYFLGTLTQDSYGALVFDDGNKDECDAYIKTLNPDFDPKSAIILKPQKHIATNRF